MRRLVLSFVLLGVSGCAVFAPPTPRFQVFFDERSSTLDAAASGVIAEAADRARALPNASVAVAGYADRFGTAQQDIMLSRQRVEVVAAQLVADGVPSSRLVPEAHGASPANDPGVESRRVEIVVGR